MSYSFLHSTSVSTILNELSGGVKSVETIGTGVNKISFSNAATGNNPIISAFSSVDSNVNTKLIGKTGGKILIGGNYYPDTDGVIGQIMITAGGSGVLSFSTTNILYKENLNNTTYTSTISGTGTAHNIIFGSGNTIAANTSRSVILGLNCSIQKYNIRSVIIGRAHATTTDFNYRNRTSVIGGTSAVISKPTLTDQDNNCIIGGSSNAAYTKTNGTEQCVVVGGIGNISGGNYSTIFGGNANHIYNSGLTSANNRYSMIFGGINNVVYTTTSGATAGTVLNFMSGKDNLIRSNATGSFHQCTYNMIAGRSNTITRGVATAIVGGVSNTITGIAASTFVIQSAIMGGLSNAITATTVAPAGFNYGKYSTILGGRGVTINSRNCVCFGKNITAFAGSIISDMGVHIGKEDNTQRGMLFLGDSAATYMRMTGTGEFKLKNFAKVSIDGILGNTSSSGIRMKVDSTGKLGTAVSSKKYKDNIEILANAIEATQLYENLFKLRPVTFTYKKDSSGRLQYGLIAEEVEKILPQICVYEDDGKLKTVDYSTLENLMLFMIQEMEKEITKGLDEIEQALSIPRI